MTRKQLAGSNWQASGHSDPDPTGQDYGKKFGSAWSVTCWGLALGKPGPTRPTRGLVRSARMALKRSSAGTCDFPQAGQPQQSGCETSIAASGPQQVGRSEWNTASGPDTVRAAQQTEPCGSRTGNKKCSRETQFGGAGTNLCRSTGCENVYTVCFEL